MALSGWSLIFWIQILEDIRRFSFQFKKKPAKYDKNCIKILGYFKRILGK